MKILGTLAFLALGLAAASAPASAAVICNGCDFLNTDSSQYLGVHNPTSGGGAGDQSTYVHNDITAGALSNLWVFDVAPAGTMNLTATFNPVAAISGFSVALRAATGGTCAAIDTACAVLPTLGATLFTNTPGTNNLSLQNIALAAGRYAFVITGTVTDLGGPESYSGNLNVFTAPVPEPATLSLLGLGLVVLAARRRRSA